jgi:putative ABC transport system permease protein
MEALARDLRYALRSLRRAPAFTITSVLILALAIGTASAMFTVFDAVLLKRLPVQDPGRLVELSGTGRGAAAGELPLSLEQYHRFSSQTRTLRSVAGFAHFRVVPEVLRDGDRWLTLRQSVVTGNFFQVLGVRPALGRLLRPEDAPEWGSDLSNGDLALIISYDAWRRVFGGDSSVVGRRLQMPLMKWNLTVVGVAPPGLDYPRGTESWLAANYQELDLIGRLAPGATPAAARNDFVAFLNSDPDITKNFGEHTVGAQVHGVSAMVVGDVRPALFALSGAVGLLLLLACVNIANLQLLRAAGRVRELAIRRALGAAAGDLARQLLTENVVLAVAGGALGLGLASILLRMLPRLAPEGLPRADMIGLAGTPIAVSGLVTLVAVLLFGIAPSLGALRFDPSSPLRSDPRAGTEGRRLRTIRQALVAWQIALALVVLSGAALLGRSFARLAGLNLGYATGHLSVLDVTMPWRRWVAQCGGNAPGSNAADSARIGECTDQLLFDYHDRVMTVLRQLPGVVSISPVAVAPFLGPSVWMVKIAAEGQSETEVQRNPFFGLEPVGPEFFRTLGVPILEGRGFTDADREGAPRVAVVTEGVARRMWANQDVIGKRFHDGPSAADSLVTIVGVVPDLHYQDLRTATPTIFRPFRQVLAQGTFVIRTRGPLAAAVPRIRRAVTEVDPEAVLLSAQSMDELIAPQLTRPRFDALLLSAFGLAALILAAIGLYGIMASGVAQQTREFGVRMALGATPKRLRGMVLGQALRVTVLGATVGLAAALAGSRVLASLLFEVSPTDPVALLGASALLIGVALLAALIPAQRATHTDPAQVMRAE